MKSSYKYTEDRNWNKAEKPFGGGGISEGVMYNMRPKLRARYLRREGKKN